MRRSVGVRLGLLVMLSAGCRTGQPIIDVSGNPATPGTIGGILQGAGGGDPFAGRRVQAVSLATGARYSAVTSVTGGFSIQVPPGNYRLEVELRAGEAVVKEPGTIHINKSDLDANIMVEVGPSPR
jgi:hypothetical protein